MDDLLLQCNIKDAEKLPKSLLRKTSKFSETDNDENVRILPAVTKSIDDDTEKCKPKNNTVQFFINKSNEIEVDCHI